MYVVRLCSSKGDPTVGLGPSITLITMGPRFFIKPRPKALNPKSPFHRFRIAGPTQHLVIRKDKMLVEAAFNTGFGLKA